MYCKETIYIRAALDRGMMNMKLVPDCIKIPRYAMERIVYYGQMLIELLQPDVLA